MPKRCYGCMKMKNQSPVCEHCGYNENVPNYPHQLPTGTILKGQYTVGKVLGQGGFGITYIGWDMSLETAVAIKEYYPGSFVNRDCAQNLTVTYSGSNVAELFEANRDRFLREARILAKLSHVPGIVRVQNLFEVNNTAYIAMEYVEGIDLKRYIRMQGRVLTAEEVFAVMRPVMYALSKVHDAELVHRDISPDNIMIQRDGSVILLDFGAARQVENADVHKDLTRSTQAILKHGFAPIEQYRSRGNLGPWTDIYALCATMYYCMTGKIPSEAPERIMGDDNVDWTQIPGLTETQIRALERGMAILPENRIRSMEELRQELFGQGRTTFTEVSRQTQIPQKNTETFPSVVENRSYGSTQKENITVPEKQEPAAASGVMETKKKKPVGLIAAAVLAVVAAVGLFAVKPKDEQPSIREITVETTEEPAAQTYYLMEDWNKSITKYSDYAEATAFSSDIKRNQVASIFFLNTLADAPENSFDVSMNQNGTVLAWFEETDAGLYDLFIGADGNIQAPSNSNALFAGYTNVRSIYFGDVFFTDNVTNCCGMFHSCSNLTELDLYNFNTINVTNMNSMFYSCSNLIELDLHNFDTSKVTSMYLMFVECENLTHLDIRNFDTANVTDMSWMFARCPNLTELNLSSFDTSKVTLMNNMFYESANLTKLDLHNFDTSSVTDMGAMFSCCSSLSDVDLSSFNTSNVTNMDHMFYKCMALKQLDLSSFHTGSVTSMNSMFQECVNLEELDISSFDNASLKSMDYMFTGCVKLPSNVMFSIPIIITFDEPDSGAGPEAEPPDPGGEPADWN